jgi:hypothetical protein
MALSTPRNISQTSPLSSAFTTCPTTSGPDAIEPANDPAPLDPIETGISDHVPQPGQRAAARQRRVTSPFSPADSRELWWRMVELQQQYGCYRSARMQAAVCSEKAARLMRGLISFFVLFVSGPSCGEWIVACEI